MSTSFLKWFFTFNVDVFFVYTLVSLYVLSKIDVRLSSSIETCFVFIANILLIVGAYTLNKVSDRPEDEVNNMALHYKHSQKIITTVIFLFAIAGVLYLIPRDSTLIYSFGILLFLSILYSFPRRFRMKNVFILKNITPAFCWAFSISLLAYTAAENIALLRIINLCIPLLILCFLFEIFWDIPDMRGDKDTGIRTLPTVMGVFQSKIILVVCLIGFISYTESVLNMIAASFMALFLLLTNENVKKNTYHSFLLALSACLFLASVLEFPI